MHMGRKLTVLWDERELGNSVMLFTYFCCCCCPSQCALPTQCPIGHLVEAKIFSSHTPETVFRIVILISIDRCITVVLQIYTLKLRDSYSISILFKAFTPKWPIA